MAKRQSARNNKTKSKAERTKAEKGDDVDPIGLLRKLTNTAKSKTVRDVMYFDVRQCSLCTCTYFYNVNSILQVFDEHDASVTDAGVRRSSMQTQETSMTSCYNGGIAWIYLINYFSISFPIIKICQIYKHQHRNWNYFLPYGIWSIYMINILHYVFVLWRWWLYSSMSLLTWTCIILKKKPTQMLILYSW